MQLLVVRMNVCPVIACTRMDTIPDSLTGLLQMLAPWPERTQQVQNESKKVRTLNRTEVFPQSLTRARAFYLVTLMVRRCTDGVESTGTKKIF